MKLINYAFLWVLVVVVLGCNGGTLGGTTDNTINDNPENYDNSGPTIINNIPVEYQNLPAIFASKSHVVKLAYAQNGYVGTVSNAEVKHKLQSMAVALSYGPPIGESSSSIDGLRYCTGTPIYESGDLAFILSAAHCVVGNPKNSFTNISPSNIVIFDQRRNYINQNVDAKLGSGNIGEITAVYVPSSYCAKPSLIMMMEAIATIVVGYRIKMVI